MREVLPILSAKDWNAAIRSQLTVAVDMYAAWCVPCHKLAPHFHDLAQKMPGAGFFKLDVDGCAEVADSLGVRALPTIVICRNGKVVQKLEGATIAQIEAAIRKHM